MTTLTTSMVSNGSIPHGNLQPLAIIPPETPPPLLPNSTSISYNNNKSLDAKKYSHLKVLEIDFDLNFYLDSIC
jgi:hypothetical protein